MRSFSFISRNFLLSLDAKPGLQIQPIETFRDLWVELRIQRYDLNRKCGATCQQWSEVGLGKGSQVADIKKSGMFSFAVFLLRLYWHFQCSSIFTFYFNFFLLCLFFFNILKSEQNRINKYVQIKQKAYYTESAKTFEIYWKRRKVQIMHKLWMTFFEKKKNGLSNEGIVHF